MRLSSLIIAALVLAGCVGTPQPNPPSIDGARLGAGTQRGTMIDIVGAVGAVEPAGATVRVTPLDSIEDPRDVLVAEDGSFSVTVERGVHRLEPRLDDRRGPVVDVAVDLGLAIVRPLSPCFEVPEVQEAAATRVGEASELEVVLVNGCASEALLAGAAMRRASDFEVVEAPARIEPGARSSVRVRFTPSAEGTREEVLLVEVSGPAVERRAVSLLGLGAR